MSAGRSVVLCAGLVALLLGATGCAEAKRGAVSGQVTLDGQSINDGEIRFIPLVGIPAWAEIVRGRYAIPSVTGPTCGEMRVEIHWSRKTGKRLPAMPPAPPGATIEETTEAIPTRYNVQSKLTAKIQPGENTADFALTTP